MAGIAIARPISVVTNVALGPLLFLALGSGVVTVVAGLIFRPLAILPGLACDLSLRAMRATIQWAASIPHGHFWLPAPPTWLVITFYILLAISLCRPGKSASRFRYGNY